MFLVEVLMGNSQTLTLIYPSLQEAMAAVDALRLAVNVERVTPH